MRRISFVGALVAVAIGAVLAFAVNGTPSDLDLQTAGLFIMLGGIVDLLVRFAIADSPLLSRESADVAAVVEPIGEPVLDAAGNPIMAPSGTFPADQARPPLVAPLPGTLPGVPRTVVYDRPTPWSGSTVVVTPDPGTVPQPMPPQSVVPQPEPGYPDAVVTEPGAQPLDTPLDTPVAPQAVRTITGRPVRPRGRAGRRDRWRR